jgi:hypothetical protein
MEAAPLGDKASHAYPKSVSGAGAPLLADPADHALEESRGHGGDTQGVKIQPPPGGVKQSGIGREGGRQGLLPYLEPKTVILDEDIATPAL